MQSPREFSKEAKASLSKEAKANLRATVLGAIRTYGPLNTDEIEERTGLRHQSASPEVLALRREGVLVQKGKRPTRSKRMAAVWGFADAGQASTQVPQPAPVSVAPSVPQDTPEGLFEVIEDPVAPALLPGNYACSKIETVNKAKVPCLRRLTHIYETRMDDRFVEGSCPAHGRVFGSLVKDKQPPTGWGQTAAPAPKTTKPRAYRKRKSR